jgi:hypothetical protein
MVLLPALFEVNGAMPLDNWVSLICLSVGYLVFMAFVAAVRPSNALSLRWVSFVHNVILSLYSLYGFIGFSAVAWNNYVSSPLDTITLLSCDPQHTLSKGTLNALQY